MLQLCSIDDTTDQGCAVVTLQGPDDQELALYPEDNEDHGYAEAANLGVEATVRHLLTRELDALLTRWRTGLLVSFHDADDPFHYIAAAAICRAGGPSLQLALLDRVGDLAQEVRTQRGGAPSSVSTLAEVTELLKPKP